MTETFSKVKQMCENYIRITFYSIKNKQVHVGLYIKYMYFNTNCKTDQKRKHALFRPMAVLKQMVLFLLVNCLRSD